MEIIGIINLIALIILALTCIVLTKKNQKNLFQIVQFKAERRTITGILSMLLLSGFVMLFIFLINRKLGLLEIESVRKIFILIKGVPVDLFNALGEEFLFRVLVFIGILYLFDNKLIALLLSSVMFCFIHNPESGITMTSYFLAGLMYGIAFLSLKTIWAPIGLHFGWNYFQGIVFGFPVSNHKPDGYLLTNINESTIWNGGPIGPEGSVAGIVGRILIIVITILIGNFFYKKLENSQFLKVK